MNAPTVAFDIRTPVADHGLVDQVIDALARGLPDLEAAAERPELLTIFANGPTARTGMTLGHGEAGPTLALNGALQLFVEKGLAPTFWAACDPQPMVADFLKDAPLETTYLVCSKCHPSVFEALRGRKVIVWHLDDFATWHLVSDRDPISTAVSITIVAFEVMDRLGFRRFETWGWDGCYLDGRDHAVPQAHRGDDRTIEVGELTFKSTTSWALEAQDARDKFAITPRAVKIRGGGMIGAILAFAASGAGQAYL